MVSDEDLGTGEEEWLEWLDQRRLPVLEQALPSRLVLVAPHPDDEVLGIGGLAKVWSDRGADVHVVAVTDGERSDPEARFSGRRRMGRRRRAESNRAQRRLSRATIHHLSLPDGAVSQHIGALTDAVARLLTPSSCCASTWRDDGHPDHEASGDAAAGAASSAGVPLIEYPVWMWHWERPTDGRVPWHRAQVAFLDAATLLAKRAALREFRSQVPVAGATASAARGAPLPEAVLDRFRRPFEVVFT